MLDAALGVEFGIFARAQAGPFNFTALELPKVEHAGGFLIGTFQTGDFVSYAFPRGEQPAQVSALFPQLPELIQHRKL